MLSRGSRPFCTRGLSVSIGFPIRTPSIDMLESGNDYSSSRSYAIIFKSHIAKASFNILLTVD